MVGLPFNPLKVQVFAGNLRTAQNRYHTLPSRTGVGSTVVFNSPQAEAEAARAQMMEASHLRSFSSPFVFFLFYRLGPWVTQSFGKNHLEVYGFGFGAMGPNPFFFSRRKGQGIFPTWLGLGHWSQAHSPPLGCCIHADPGRSLEPAEAGGFLVAKSDRLARRFFCFKGRRVGSPSLRPRNTKKGVLFSFWAKTNLSAVYW